MPDSLLTGIVFIAILGVLVYFHEFGHFSIAKLLGMKVTEFAFGFGPRLVTLGKRKDTEYTIRAIPLGGFVRLPGMDYTIEDPDELREKEGIEPEEAFNAQPVWKRGLVIFAGPVASLLFGYLVFIIMGATFGWPTGLALPKVAHVQEHTPADWIGLQRGDTIREIDGVRVTTGEQLVRYIHARPEEWVTLKVERGGETITLRSKTMAVAVEGGKKQGRLGFSPDIAMERTGVAASVRQGTQQTVGYITMLVGTLFSREIAKNVGGIVAIARITGETVQMGAFWVVLQLAALSLTLGIINLLPLPILDGGHLLFLGLEKVRGRRLAPQVQIWITQVGFVLLVFLALLLVYVDLLKWISGTPLQ